MKKIEQKTKEEIFEEIRKLADRANEISGNQLDLFATQKVGDEDIDLGFNSSILNDTANPEKSHKLYYGIRRLLIEYLPRGEENKKFRQRVYDEKNLFLNRGVDRNKNGLRGSDGRMTYLNTFLWPTFNLVIEWIKKGANYYDIWQDFYDLNEKHSFHKK